MIPIALLSWGGKDAVAELTINGDVGGDYGAQVRTYFDSSEDGTATSILTVTGNVAAEDTGINVYSRAKNEGSANTTVTIGNDVTVKSDRGDVKGIYVYSDAGNEGSANTTVTVGKDVAAEADDGYAQGIIISAYPNEDTDSEDYTVTVEVGGGVSTDGMGATGIQVNGTGRHSETPFIGTATVTVNEDVEATAKERSAVGLEVSASGEGTDVKLNVGGVAASSDGENGYVAGVDVYAADKASVTVTVGEDGISATGGNTDNNIGAYLRVEGDATASLSVAGDVTVDGEGIVLGGYADPEDEEDVPGHIDVFVEGTVSGGDNSIQLVSSALESSDVDLAVWKADLNKDGNVVGTYDFVKSKEYLKEQLDDGYFTQEEYDERLSYLNKEEETIKQNAPAIEEGIKYLIRVEKNGNGEYKEYKGLDFTNAEMVNDYYAATEATEVTLKATSGYKVISILDSENGANTYVTKDKNGVYHILIPKGGGVWLNVKVEKIEPAADNGWTYVPVYALGKLTAKDGSVLTIYNNRTYTVAYADGTGENGSWKVADSQIIFTNASGEEIAPELDGDGNAVYTFKEGTEFVLTPDIVNAVEAYRVF